MKSRSRGRAPATLLLATVAAAAFGGLAAVALVTLRPPAPRPPDAARSDGARSDGADPETRRNGRRTRDRDGTPGGTPRVRGDRRAGREEARRGADAELESRLSDPDERTRHLAALELLRAGPSALSRLSRLEPPTREGQVLVGRIESALDVLRVIEQGPGYHALPEESRRELRLKYFRKVVPDEVLGQERRDYWERKVETDRARVAEQQGSPGELAFSRLELALARRDLGEISAFEYAGQREELLDDARAWVAELRARGAVDAAQLRAYDERLARLAAPE